MILSLSNCCIVEQGGRGSRSRLNFLHAFDAGSRWLLSILIARRVSKGGLCTFYFVSLFEYLLTKQFDVFRGDSLISACNPVVGPSKVGEVLMDGAQLHQPLPRRPPLHRLPLISSSNRDRLDITFHLFVTVLHIGFICLLNLDFLLY